MNKNYKSNERELVKVVNFFKRQSKMLIAEGKLGDEHRKIEETVDNFIAQMDNHANVRATVLEEREYLNKLVKDNAECPRCHTKDMIKVIGTEKNEKGWKSNRYKCRKCNIQFTWNRPNNPWDMIQYLEEVMAHLRLQSQNSAASEEEKQQALVAIEGMEGSLDKLKPVIDAHDKEYNALVARDNEMEQLIHEFKNSLLIEKIKMDTWDNKKKK